MLISHRRSRIILTRGGSNSPCLDTLSLATGGLFSGRRLMGTYQAGSGWVRLGSSGFVWAGLGLAGLGWVGRGRIELYLIGLDCMHGSSVSAAGS